jgi:hypothetical protein
MNYSSFIDEQPGIRYTTDGSDPTTQSPRFDWGVPVHAPALVTVKQFSNWGPDKSVKGRFRLGTAFAATRLPTGFTPGGFTYRCVPGPFQQWPSSPPTIIGSGRTDEHFNVAKLGDGRPFACRFTGQFKAEREGYYVFFLSADQSANLRLHGRLLMHSARGEERSFVVPLKSGYHPVELEYSHDTGNPSLTLTYLPLRGRDTLARLPIPIPVELQYGRDPLPPRGAKPVMRPPNEAGQEHVARRLSSATSQEKS